MRSVQEIWRAVLSLSPSELLRLESYAQWRVRWLGRKALGRNENDLLGEAITATVTGQRVWTERVDFCSHLLGAMRSISTSWHEKIGEEYLESELAKPGVETPLDRPITTVDPERILRAKERLEQVRQMFANDAVASQVIELLGVGYTGKEIQSQLGLSARGYGAVAKRIRRKLQAELPELYRARLVANLQSSLGRKQLAQV